jgi:putative nucleotidyltransferase with HDIG domain
MTGVQERRIRRWWNRFVRRYDAADAEVRLNTRLKESHTLRVCRETLAIGRALGLSPEDLRLAEILALLHDVGRFEQFARYRTFADVKSENHALLSLAILRREGVLKPLSPRTQSIIRRAIRYHNRAEVPAVHDRRLLLFARLLRDADKLDIWRLALAYYAAPPGRKNHAISIGLPDLPGVTPEVLEDLRKKRIVASRNIRSLTDLKLLQMGWVFDVNFVPTLRLMLRRGYLEKMRNVLPVDDAVWQAHEVVRAYVERRLAGSQGTV